MGTDRVCRKPRRRAHLPGDWESVVVQRYLRVECLRAGAARRGRRCSHSLIEAAVGRRVKLVPVVQRQRFAPELPVRRSRRSHGDGKSSEGAIARGLMRGGGIRHVEVRKRRPR